VRQVTTPWPYSAPKIKAPFITPGTTPMQTAFVAMLSGMALSGVDMISSMTARALSSRESSFSTSEAQNARVDIPAMHNNISSFFMDVSSLVFSRENEYETAKKQFACHCCRRLWYLSTLMNVKGLQKMK
jgi:hypothetical protein